MAMDTGSKGSLKSDINVTPLVDVMLVLLIIMMLIAPMIHNDAVALPEARHSTQKPEKEDQTVVAIDAVNQIYVNALPVKADDLVPRVQRVLEEKTDKVVYVKGDKDAKYSAIMSAMDALRQAQIENIALITERRPDQENKTAGGGH